MSRACLAGKRVQPGSDSVLRKCFVPLNLRAMVRIRSNLMKMTDKALLGPTVLGKLLSQHLRQWSTA